MLQGERKGRRRSWSFWKHRCMYRAERGCGSEGAGGCTVLRTVFCEERLFIYSVL